MPKHEEWRKSRTFTWMAVTASVLVVAVFGYTLFKVNVLETEYGEIQGNKVRILRQIENREEQHAELLAKIQKLETEKSLLEDDLAVSRVRQEELAALNEGVASSEATLKDLQGAIVEANQKLMEQESVEIALEESRGEQSELAQQKVRLNAEIASLQRELNTANDEAREAKNKRDQFQDEVSDLLEKKQQRDEAESELNAAQNALTAIQDKLRNADKNLAEREASASDAERRFSQAEKDLTSLSARIATRQTELESKSNDANAEATRLAGLEQDRENLSEQVDRLKAEETRLKLFVERNAKAEAALESTSQALQLARDEKTEIEAELVAKRNEIQDERIKISEVKVEVAALRQNISLLEADRQEATNKRDAVDSEILAKSQTRETLAEQLNTVSAELASETTLLAQKSGERIAEEARLADLQTKAVGLSEVEAKLAELQPQLDARENAAKAAEISLAKLSGKIEAEQISLSSLRQEINDTSGDLDSLNNQKSKLDARINELAAEKADFEAEVAALEQLITNRESSLKPQPTDQPTDDTGAQPEGDN
ncbi:hypothetical protein [Tateyamaria sp. Alg231-49]|uniref:hypothetical protein n=1 Tax=Tateyamaria sp. Alg231-49 TaxID=1922219 RepID=UPI000D557851|nr:hypothetical protein [Tateyamaria sp. Alg231-49]